MDGRVVRVVDQAQELIPIILALGDMLSYSSVESAAESLHWVSLRVVRGGEYPLGTEECH